MSYRPPSHQPKGAWARHLHEQRKARDLSAVAAFELVYERIGWSPKSRTAYIAIDMGDRKPKPNEAVVLAAEFGWPPDPVDLPEPVGVGDVTAAIYEQTKAITALVDELRQERSARASVESRLERLQSVVDLMVERTLGQPGTPAPSGRGAPQT